VALAASGRSNLNSFREGLRHSRRGYQYNTLLRFADGHAVVSRVGCVGREGIADFGIATATGGPQAERWCRQPIYGLAVAALAAFEKAITKKGEAWDEVEPFHVQFAPRTDWFDWRSETGG
jgi:hypothetical protein